jgi:hypothetical protein
MHHHTQQAVGIWPFSSAVNFDKSNKEMTDIANAINRSKMPAQIPITQAQQLVDKTNKTVNRFVSDAQPVIENSPGVRDSLRAAVRVVVRDQEQKMGRLQGIINTARAQGQTTVASFQFNHRDIPLMLHSVVGGYEAVQFIDEAKPFLVRSMPFTVGLFVTVGRVVEAIVGAAQATYSGLKAGVDAAASGTQMMIDILKWGSVAGGLYLLYKTLEPGSK